jgi:hypothetical protein
MSTKSFRNNGSPPVKRILSTPCVVLVATIQNPVGEANPPGACNIDIGDCTVPKEIFVSRNDDVDEYPSRLM